MVAPVYSRYNCFYCEINLAVLPLRVQKVGLLSLLSDISSGVQKEMCKNVNSKLEVM